MPLCRSKNGTNQVNPPTKGSESIWPSLAVAQRLVAVALRAAGSVSHASNAWTGSYSYRSQFRNQYLQGTQLASQWL